MSINQIKEEMLKWRDSLGFDIAASDDIKQAKSKKELETILRNHIRGIENLCVDAVKNAEAFRYKLFFTKHIKGKTNEHTH